MGERMNNLRYYITGAVGFLDVKANSNEQEMDDFLKKIENVVVLDFDVYLSNPSLMMVSCSNVDNWKLWLLKYAKVSSMVTVLKQRTASGVYYSVGYGNLSPRIKV